MGLSLFLSIIHGGAFKSFADNMFALLEEMKFEIAACRSCGALRRPKVGLSKAVDIRRIDGLGYDTISD